MSGAEGSARTVVVAPSWLGDCIMALPALQRYVSEHDGCPVDVVSKPAVSRIWEMSPVVGRVIPLPSGLTGMRAAVAQLRKGGYARAIVLPNSWRSGLLALLGGVTCRRGAPGHGRGWMLTERVRELPVGHQSLESAALCGVAPDALPPPALDAPSDAVARLLDRLGLHVSGPCVAIVPGAARGPAKRWPIERFIAVAKAACGELGATVLACGTPAERELCEQLTVVPGVINLAGQTTLQELALLLGTCISVVCNDSGGMHLAGAMGTPVVAIFGLTDPSRTGPLGEGHRLVVAEGVQHDRRIGRDDEAARAALASIPVSQVVEALHAVCREARS